MSPERLLLLMGRPAEKARRLAAQGVDWERVIAEDRREERGPRLLDVVEDAGGNDAGGPDE